MDRKISMILIISIVAVAFLLGSSFLLMNSLESKINSSSNQSLAEQQVTATATPNPTQTPETEQENTEDVLDESEEQDVVYSDWEFLVEVVESCQATSITQLHNQDVMVSLENGIVLTAQEPDLDDIIEIYDSVKEDCGDIPIATE